MELALVFVRKLPRRAQRLSADLNLEGAEQTVKEIQSLSYQAAAKKLDVTDAEQIDQCVREIKEEYGAINY